MENTVVSPRSRRVGRLIRRLSPARAAVLAKLHHQPEPVTLAALVEVTGLHENTVREHLDGLLRAGLVERHRAAPVGRGRPAWLYQVTERDGSVAEYAGLAAALARTIARTSDHPARAAGAAGEEWGHDLAQLRGGTASSATQARRHAVAVLDDLGFESEVDESSPSEVWLTRCPLLEAAYRHTEVVCAVHLGLVRGLLEASGADPTGTRLFPFAGPSTCRLVVPPLGDPTLAPDPAVRPASASATPT